MSYIKKIKCLIEQVNNIVSFRPKLEYDPATKILTGTFANGKHASTPLPLQILTTDETLYIDTNTSEIRSNIGYKTDKWVWTSGVQDFILTHTPRKIVYISVNGQLLEDDLLQWSLDVANKKVTILDILDPNDRISIYYHYLIIP